MASGKHAVFTFEYLGMQSVIRTAPKGHFRCSSPPFSLGALSVLLSPHLFNPPSLYLSVCVFLLEADKNQALSAPTSDPVHLS